MRKIDIHVHICRKKPMNRYGTESTFCTAEEIIAKYEAMDIEKGVILPTVNPECCYMDIQSLEDVTDIIEKYPDRFTWFLNIDPRAVSNSHDSDFTPLIKYYSEKGARGIGELCANLYFDDPMMQNIYNHCQKHNLPLIFHMAPKIGGYYGLADELGMPRLEMMLKKYISVKFLGHSQCFWAEISSDLTQEGRFAYPKGKVKPGRVVELMEEYPNMCGDLSAGSGFNAVSRDPEFGYKFLEKFCDKLYYGTDFCAPENIMPLADFLDDAVQNARISRRAYNKIIRENSMRLLNL